MDFATSSRIVEEALAPVSFVRRETEAYSAWEIPASPLSDYKFVAYAYDDGELGLATEPQNQVEGACVLWSKQFERADGLSDEELTEAFRKLVAVVLTYRTRVVRTRKLFTTRFVCEFLVGEQWTSLGGVSWLTVGLPSGCDNGTGIVILESEPQDHESGHTEAFAQRQCVVVSLQDQLVLATGLTWPATSFVIDGTEFRDIGLGDWTGFYDWLRNVNGSLIGVRYWLNESTEFLGRRAEGLKYANVDPERSIELYFSHDRAVEPTLSCDQAFRYNPVFQDDDATFAIAFDAEDLTESDLDTMQRFGQCRSVGGLGGKRNPDKP